MTLYLKSGGRAKIKELFFIIIFDESQFLEYLSRNLTAQAIGNIVEIV